jgi:hypothetical protein
MRASWPGWGFAAGTLEHLYGRPRWLGSLVDIGGRMAVAKRGSRHGVGRCELARKGAL